MGWCVGLCYYSYRQGVGSTGEGRGIAYHGRPDDLGEPDHHWLLLRRNLVSPACTRTTLGDGGPRQGKRSRLSQTPDGRPLMAISPEAVDCRQATGGGGSL